MSSRPPVLLVAIAFCLVPISGSAEPSSPFRDYMAELSAAMVRGDGERAMDLMCDSFEYDLRAATEELGQDAVMSFLDSCTRFQHQRYDEFFRPPENVGRFFAPHRPRFTWETYSFTSSGFGGLAGRSHEELYGEENAEDRPHLRVTTGSSPRFTLDLDLDGSPELTYAGTEPDIAPTLVAQVDHSPDGTRTQWLLAPEGTDPRIAPHVWMYRDGPAFFMIVDIGGDGEKAFGRSHCFF